MHPQGARSWDTCSCSVCHQRKGDRKSEDRARKKRDRQRSRAEMVEQAFERTLDQHAEALERLADE